MDLTTAAHLFRVLGAPGRLAAFLRLRRAPGGLPPGLLAEGDEAAIFDEILRDLQAAGLVVRRGAAGAEWYVANPGPLDRALACAAARCDA